MRSLATLASWVYGLAAGGHRRLYDQGWLQSRRLPAPVLSIGNLTVGGTGKTPLTACLARRFQASGRQVVILSRGYGVQIKKVQVISDRENLLVPFPRAGDEPYLLARQLPGIPVLTGVDRYQAGLKAWELFRPDLFLLDDGFQHLPLHRDHDLVLLDASRPFGNGRLLPRGTLREPLSTLHRPLTLVLTRYQESRHWRQLETIRAAFPECNLIRALFRHQQVVSYPRGQALALDSLVNHKLFAFAGLARPGVFAESLQELGILPVDYAVFPDHYPYKLLDIQQMVSQARQLGAEALITTAKDWVRLPTPWDQELPLLVLGLEVELMDPLPWEP